MVDPPCSSWLIAASAFATLVSGMLRRGLWQQRFLVSADRQHALDAPLGFARGSGDCFVGSGLLVRCLLRNARDLALAELLHKGPALFCVRGLATPLRDS